jgi:hypothetical protein
MSPRDTWAKGPGLPESVVLPRMPALTDRDDILRTVLDASPCREGAATRSQTIWAPDGPAAASVACYRCGQRTAAVVGLMRIDPNIAASSLIDGSLGLAQRLLL